MRKIALFDKPMPYKTREVQNGWVVDFTTPKGQEVQLSCFMRQMPLQEVKPDEWFMLDPPPVIFFLSFTNKSQPHNPYGTTGTGEELPIFSTVIKATLEMFDKTRASEDGEITVKFDAKATERGRTSLYAGMANGLARARGGKAESYVKHNDMYYKIVFPPTRPVEYKKPDREPSPMDQVWED